MNVRSASLPIFSVRPAAASLWASLSVCRVAWEWWLDEVWCLAGPVLWPSLDPVPVEKDCRCAQLVLRAAGATASSKGLCRVAPPPLHPRPPVSSSRSWCLGTEGSKAGSGIWVTSPVPWLPLPPSETGRSLRPGPGTILICGRSKQGKAQRPSQFPPTSPNGLPSEKDQESLGSRLGSRPGFKARADGNPAEGGNQDKVGSTCFGQTRLFLTGTLNRCFFLQLLPGISRILEESLWKLRGQICNPFPITLPMKQNRMGEFPDTVTSKHEFSMV